jgi:hypothetical protein
VGRHLDDIHDVQGKRVSISAFWPIGRSLYSFAMHWVRALL